MGRVLPLLALRAFAETGRHGSIKRAAEAMGVTSGAVSQQLRLLEERIAASLFSRTRYGVELTEVGAKVHLSILRAFDQIESGLDALEASCAAQSVTVCTVPSFAASWLVPRLGHFTTLHPEIGSSGSLVGPCRLTETTRRCCDPSRAGRLPRSRGNSSDGA